MSFILKKEKLQELMIEKFYTISKIAKDADVSYPIILNAYNHSKPVSMKTAEKICKIFNVEFKVLFME